MVVPRAASYIIRAPVRADGPAVDTCDQACPSHSQVSPLGLAISPIACGGSGSERMDQSGRALEIRIRARLLDITNQRRNGSWDPDCHDYDAKLGRAYTTALAVLALSPPYQLLPIFQR